MSLFFATIIIFFSFGFFQNMSTEQPKSLKNVHKPSKKIHKSPQICIFFLNCPQIFDFSYAGTTVTIPAPRLSSLGQIWPPMLAIWVNSFDLRAKYCLLTCIASGFMKPFLGCSTDTVLFTVHRAGYNGSSLLPLSLWKLDFNFKEAEPQEVV